MPAQLPIRTGSTSTDTIRATRGFHWWYPAIIDRMISHPEWSKQDIARDMGIAYSTVYIVTSCDLFRAHLERRREEFSRAHDDAIRNRLIKAATVSLDKLIETVEQKPAGTIPIPQLVEMSTKVLDKLGYGPQVAPSPSFQVNLNQQNNTVVQATTQDLLEARAALRRSEGLRLIEAEPSLSRPEGTASQTFVPVETNHHELEHALPGDGDRNERRSPSPSLEDL